MADKFTIRNIPEYKEFLESEFDIRELSEQEELLFGGTLEAVDKFFEEYPEAADDNYIDLSETESEELND